MEPDNLYPPESKKLDVIGHLEELRKRLLICLGWLAGTSALLFWQGHELIRIATKPLGLPAQNLIFISPAEAFTSYVKMTLVAGFIVCFPVILYQTWLFVAPAVPKDSRKNIVAWLVSAFFLFASGILFSYFVVIPAALDFLLNFGKDIAQPHITLSHYVSFFVSFILIGGTIFEIPIVIGLATDAGFLKSKLLKDKRPYAMVVIFIVAAVVTPTQDAVNMVIIALPMLGLYEVGIFISGIIERTKHKTKR